jgi:membrane-bound lytic murein transglycosylase C
MNKRIILATSLGLAITILPACTTSQLVNLALQKDPERALKSMAKNRVNTYKEDPRVLIADIKRAEREYDRLMGNLQKQSGAKWGKRESRTLPSRTRYVKYTEDYKNRVVVDFDQGTILVEHLEENNVQDKLKNAIVTALLTPDDPRAVDLFSDKPVGLSGTPYLQGLVADQNNKLINTPQDADQYAGYLVGNKLQTRSIDVNGVSKQVSFVQFAMINTHIEQRALKFSPQVRKQAEASGVSRSLIYAVMKTESGFNPFAVSSAPAYGLMQLVPTSGGREAYRKVKGVDASPSKDYLFEADNNIELGSAYLGILMNDSQLNQIRNQVSREYCAIAAYNTGPGNVLRTFDRRTDDAIDRINSLKPDQVYDILRTRLPYEETRGYIVKVVSAKKQFTAM